MGTVDKATTATVLNHIYDSGSLSVVARALGLSHPMVSRYLDEMEKWTDVRLIRRSSRRSAITPADEDTLVKTRSLAQLSLDIGAASAAQIPSSTLYVACTHLTTTHILAPVLPTLMAQHPQLRIEVEINNQPVSLVGERIDVAIRITNSPKPGTIARWLGDCKSVSHASADYPHQYSTPEIIDDLTWHSCLYYSDFAGQSRHFLDPQGQPAPVTIKGNLSAGISSLFCESAVAGMGIASVSELETQEGLEQGELIRLLPELQPKCLPIYGLYPSREHQPVGLRLLPDMLSEVQR